MQNNSIRVICADGVVRTATYRGEYSPSDRVFVRVSGKTITGRAERQSFAVDAPLVFRPDAFLKNSNLIKTIALFAFYFIVTNSAGYAAVESYNTSDLCYVNQQAFTSVLGRNAVSECYNGKTGLPVGQDINN